MKTASTSAKIRLLPWEMKGSENIGLYFECTVFPDIFCFFFSFSPTEKIHDYIQNYVRLDTIF